MVFDEEAPAGASVLDDRLLFLGDDQQGVALEVMALEINRRDPCHEASSAL
jgi:hypothetical protein